MSNRTEMRDALLDLTYEAVEDMKAAKYKNYTRRPRPCMPGKSGDPNWTYEKWIDEEYERVFAPRKSFLQRLFG